MKNFPSLKVVSVMLCLFYWLSCTQTQSNATSTVTDSASSDVELFDTVVNRNTKSEVSLYETMNQWLTISIQQEVVVDKIGNPENKSMDEYWGSTGTFVQKWEYSSLGISMEMESETEGENKSVRSILLSYPCKYQTTKGVGIGTNVSLLKDKYSELMNCSDSDSTAFVLGSVYGGTIFYLNDSLVTKIFIGAVAE